MQGNNMNDQIIRTGGHQHCNLRKVIDLTHP